jgi:hypothetical protein
MRYFIRVLATGLAVAGVGMYVWHGLTADEVMPWLNGWMAAPIIALTVLPVVFSFTGGGFGGGSKALRNGPLAVGTIVDVQQTGMYINEQPQMRITMDVTTPDGQTFRGVAKQIVLLNEMSMVVPGVTLPVHYNPAKMDGTVRIANQADPAAVQEAFLRTRLATGEMSPEQYRVTQQGVDAQAVIVQMTPTGEVRNGGTVIDFVLQVTTPDGQTFESHPQKVIQPQQIASVQPGMVVQAQYIPGEDANQVLLALPVNG